MYQDNKQHEQTTIKYLKGSKKIFNTIFIKDNKIKGKSYRSVILGWKRKEDEEKINALDML